MKLLIILSTVLCALATSRNQQIKSGWVRQNIRSNNQIDPSSSSSESSEQSANILKTLIYNPNHCRLIPEPTSDEISLFRQWTAKHNKQYLSDREKACRMSIVVNTIRDIHAHNQRYDQGKETYKRGLNHLSDLTMQEVRDRILMKKPKSQLAQSKLADLPVLPDARESVDYRQEGLVGPIAQQGECGSCYAWSSAAVLEGQLRKCGINKNPVSVQNMVDCTEGCDKCKGGLPYFVFQYEKYGGILPADKYPYLDANGTCAYNKSDIIAYVDQAYGFNFEEISGRHEYIKKIVSVVGPISVGLCAEQSFKDYSTGVYNVDNCGTEANHAVTIVGYGIDPRHGEYWLIKNSWGKFWGENGYGRVAMGKNLCEFESEVYFAQIRDSRGKVCELFDF